jgi:hypothetical protein
MMNEDRIYTSVAVIGGDPETNVERCMIFNNVTVNAALDLFSEKLRDTTGFSPILCDAGDGAIVLGVKHLLVSDTMIQSY